MKLSQAARKSLKKAAKDGYDPLILQTYFYAQTLKAEVDFFPDWVHEYQIKGSLTNDVIPKEWIAQWVAKWPTPGQLAQRGIHLNYSVSGNRPECIKRMQSFFKQFDEYVYEADVEEKMRLVDEATDRYLEKKWDDPDYWKKNHKFILDENGSVLAEYILRGTDKQSTHKAFFL